MSFASWFQKFCSNKGLGELQHSSDSMEEKGTLEKEILLGEGAEQVVIKFLIKAQNIGTKLTLECVVATIPFNQFRRLAFLQQRLCLNTPHETGGVGYLTVRGKNVLFVSSWREVATATTSERDANLHFSEFVARARRYRKIFYDYTIKQLQESGDGDVLALQGKTISNNNPATGALKI